MCNNLSKYSFNEHLHNYSVWTSARAVQRGFTTTKNIKEAIENTELQQFAELRKCNNSDEFDMFHKKTAINLINNLKEKGIETTYGRAAKIIAIYLKTCIVIRDSGISEFSKIIHPPIDNILLTNLSNEYKHLDIINIRWTQLNEIKYFELIAKLRSLQYEYFWEIEKFWTPIQNEN